MIDMVVQVVDYASCVWNPISYVLFLFKFFISSFVEFPFFKPHLTPSSYVFFCFQLHLQLLFVLCFFGWNFQSVPRLAFLVWCTR